MLTYCITFESNAICFIMKDIIELNFDTQMPSSKNLCIGATFD